MSDDEHAVAGCSETCACSVRAREAVAERNRLEVRLAELRAGAAELRRARPDYPDTLEEIEERAAVTQALMPTQAEEQADWDGLDEPAAER